MAWCVQSAAADVRHLEERSPHSKLLPIALRNDSGRAFPLKKRLLLLRFGNGCSTTSINGSEKASRLNCPAKKRKQKKQRYWGGSFSAQGSARQRSRCVRPIGKRRWSG